MRVSSVVLVSLLWISASAWAGGVKPKYGLHATVLSESHDFFRRNKAPDFWALIPHYAAQINERACSVASVAMVINAARAGQDLSSDERLVTQQELLQRVDGPFWREAVGSSGHGVTLAQLGALVAKALKAYGLKGSVEVVTIKDTSNSSKKAFREALKVNEMSAGGFLIANFLQGSLTGDAMVGHIAPIGAYDQKKGAVLILDPDREWYEPYWVGEETLLSAMATRDERFGEYRGYIILYIPL